MVIIKSKGKNWEGKGFSKALPAKVYNSFDDAVAALNSYHFFTYDQEEGEYLPTDKTDKLEFIFLKEDQIKKMITDQKIRF